MGTALFLVIAGWTLLTIYVERKGPVKQWTLGESGGKKVLIVFDPDPFYNLDEQVCKSMGNALADRKMNVEIATVAAAEYINPESAYEVIVYCANTYNWRPDWAITSFIQNHSELHRKRSVVAITLGAGSTQASKKHFEDVITNSGGQLLKSHTLWLWRPNDKKRMKDSNIQVAVEQAYNWGKDIAVSPVQ